jgi:hypothetical protein
MSFELRAIDGGKWELLFSDEPSYIHALNMAPDSIEPEMKSGLWLIVVFPVWSSPVRHSVRAALACAKDYGGKFQLGVRPYDYYEEIFKWWPGGKVPSEGDQLLVAWDEPRRELHISTDSSSSPIWLILRDGQVVNQGAGPYSRQQLSELMQSVLGAG